MTSKGPSSTTCDCCPTVVGVSLRKMKARSFGPSSIVVIRVSEGYTGSVYLTLMKFYLIERQAAACSYTIGCGIRVKELRATDLKSAMEEAALIIDTAWDKRNEWAIDSAELLAVSESINLKEFLDMKQAEKLKEEEPEAEADTREAEEAEFERLKKKLGKK